MLSTYNRLQSDSHFRRRKNLEELQDNYVRFATDECYPNLVQIFYGYNQWIKERSNMIQDFERIQQSFQKQCDDIMNYVEMIENLRLVVYRNIRELGSGSAMQTSQEYMQPLTAAAPRYESTQQSEALTSHLQASSLDDNPNKNFMEAIRGTTKKTILHAEEGLTQLDTLIQKLRTSIGKK